jgi:hypothetical protein
LRGFVKALGVATLALLVIHAGSVVLAGPTPASTGKTTVKIGTKAAQKGERATRPPPIDPQSAAFLEAIEAPESAVTGTAAAPLRLWSRMVFAELPDWDPSRELHRIRTLWEQIAGPVAKMQDASGIKATAVLPEVATTTRLQFRVTMTNRSGSVQRTLLVDVHPRS